MLYLASGSPRRRELLQQIGVPFDVVRAAVDETAHPGEEPLDYVMRLAAAKAQAGFALLRQQGVHGALVLGSDTAGVLHGEILGKPRDRDDAIAMLVSMGGHTHQVITGVALAGDAGVQVAHAITDVTFRPISAREAEAYWATGEPADKAGAYGIQGFGAIFVARIEGSYTGVVGLPLFETAQLLQQAGVAIWQAEGVQPR
jgi:septum formation protein